MILSDVEIREALAKGDLRIELPEGEELYVGPSSVDLHLDNKAMILDEEKTKMASSAVLKDPSTDSLKFHPELYRCIRMDEPSEKYFSPYTDWDEITIFPGEFYILSSKEKLTFNGKIAGFIQGRSSIARLGINIHAAGFFDPNFSGTATLEVTNFTKCPIVIPKNTRICQMVFVRTGKESSVGYDKKKDSKYQEQSGPTLTQIHQDFYGRHNDE